jgi:hypothetical protein
VPDIPAALLGPSTDANSRPGGTFPGSKTANFPRAGHCAPAEPNLARAGGPSGKWVSNQKVWWTNTTPMGCIQRSGAEGREPLLRPCHRQLVCGRRCRLALKHAKAADLIVTDIDEGVGNDTVDVFELRNVFGLDQLGDVRSFSGRASKPSQSGVHAASSNGD